MSSVLCGKHRRGPVPTTGLVALLLALVSGLLRLAIAMDPDPFFFSIDLRRAISAVRPSPKASPHDIVENLTVVHRRVVIAPHQLVPSHGSCSRNGSCRASWSTRPTSFWRRFAGLSCQHSGVSPAFIPRSMRLLRCLGTATMSMILGRRLSPEVAIERSSVDHPSLRQLAVQPHCSWSGHERQAIPDLMLEPASVRQKVRSE